MCSACSKGYSGSGKTKCSDIDDCATSKRCVSPDTLVQLKCINQPGISFKCDCGSSYFGANGTCFINNKCSLSPCDKNGACSISGPGKFTCKCNKGYTGDGLLSCKDVNGCATGSCDKLTTCSDVAASADTTGKDFKCSACPSGYAGNGKIGCSDIDDCVGNPCGGGGKCSNDVAGSGKWKCKCDLGYK